MNLLRPIKAALLPVFGGFLVAAGLLLGAATGHAATDPRQLAVPSDPEGNKACLACHSRQATMTRDGQPISIHVNGQQYAESAHGILSCARCHAEVGPEHAKDPRKPLDLPTGRDLAVLKSQGCVKCHAGVYQQSYEESFHGIAIRHGDNRAATCVDCHGIHNVFPSRNPNSTVAPDKLAKTCGTAECHPGAPENFSKGTEHFVASVKETSPGLHIIYKFFMGLILFDTLKDGPIVMFELLRRLRS